MNIGKKYKIESDSMNVTIFERSVISKSYKGRVSKHGGEEVWKPIRYYSNLKNALDGLIDLEINGTGLQSVQDILAKIAELRSDIMQALGNAIPTGRKATPVAKK